MFIRANIDSSLFVEFFKCSV